MGASSSADLVVIGAGPAGLAVALRVAENGHNVTLVDAGGDGVDASAADLHRGPVLSSVDQPDSQDEHLVGGTLYPHNHLEATRWRQPGGSSHRWWALPRPSGERSVRMAQALPIDFRARPQFEIPGFPIEAHEVLRYRDDALRFLGLSGHSFDVSEYDDGRRAAALGDGFYDKLFHFPKARMIQEVRPADAAEHPAVDFRTGLHLRRFLRTGHRIDAVEFVDRHGEIVTLRSKRIVLAMGGVENSRQLLAAARDGSIPNPHDLLGRYFMDHPHLRLGYLEDANVEDLAYYDFQQVRDTYVLRGHGIAPELAESEDLLRFCVDLVGRHRIDSTQTGFALGRLKYGMKRHETSEVRRSVATLSRHPIDALRLGRFAKAGRVHHTGIGGWSDDAERLLPVGVTAVESMFEQRPSYDNRVRLSGSVDRYGVPLPALQWSFSDMEVDAIDRAVEVTSQAFNDAGFGALTTMKSLGGGPIPRAGTGMHHLGGTRMHADPTEGVVDADARMHELDNVYIAGSSIFSTSVGYANPTFTVLQFALRLGDHLCGMQGPAFPTLTAEMPATGSA